MKRERKTWVIKFSQTSLYKIQESQRFSTSDDQKANQYMRIETNPVEKMKNKAKPT